MTPHVIAPLAQADLVEIWDYIARDNQAAADRLISLLCDKFTVLARNPSMGQLRPELRPNLRSFVARKYVIYYELARDHIRILRVLHGARDVTGLSW